MRQDVFGEVRAAIGSARAAGLLSGPYNGVPAPKLMAGKMRFPGHLRPNGDAGGVTLTASLYYFTPWWFDGGETFAGANFRQIGDNSSKHIKIAFYKEAPTGGPFALAKSFGTFACGGSTAINQMASSWTPDRGWHYGALVSDSTAVLYGMSVNIPITNAGYIRAFPQTSLLGCFAADFYGAGLDKEPQGESVAGTYSNFPEATALTPTAMVLPPTGAMPAFGLYA